MARRALPGLTVDARAQRPVSRSVLLTVANGNQAANALPVIERLLEWNVACKVVVLDPVYLQDAGGVVSRSPVTDRITWSAAPSRELEIPFSKQPMTARWRAVREFDNDVVAAAGDHDGVVVGMDGAFERLVLKRYRNAGRFTAIVWDGLVRHRPRLLGTGVSMDAIGDVAGMTWHVGEWGRFMVRRAVLRGAVRLGREAYVPGLAGHTPVDTIYTAGRFVTEAFRSQGVTGSIETTGIPRFAALASTEHRARPVERRRVVYLTGSFAWHDWTALDRAQQRDLDALAEALPGRGWQLTIRIHPREDAARYARFQGRPGVALSTGLDAPLWAELAGAGAVVTAISTAGLEALALGRPLVVFLRAFPRSLQNITLGTHPRIPVARTVEALDAALTASADRQDTAELSSVLADFVDPGTADSAQRIADSIARRL